MPIKTLSEKKRIWTELWIQLVFFMSIWSWICKKNWKILLSNWNQLNKSPKVDAFQFPEDFLLIQFVSSDYIWVCGLEFQGMELHLLKKSTKRKLHIEVIDSNSSITPDYREFNYYVLLVNEIVFGESTSIMVSSWRKPKKPGANLRFVINEGDWTA